MALRLLAVPLFVFPVRTGKYNNEKSGYDHQDFGNEGY